MAKTPTDHIRDLTAQVRVLEDRDATRRADLDELKARLQQEIDERKTAEVKNREEFAQLHRELAEARQENAVLKQQLQDHIKHTELSDSRRWALILAFVSALLALASGLIVALARK